MFWTVLFLLALASISAEAAPVSLNVDVYSDRFRIEGTDPFINIHDPNSGPSDLSVSWSPNNSSAKGSGSGNLTILPNGYRVDTAGSFVHSFGNPNRVFAFRVYGEESLTFTVPDLGTANTEIIFSWDVDITDLELMVPTWEVWTTEYTDRETDELINIGFERSRFTRDQEPEPFGILFPVGSEVDIVLRTLLRNETFARGIETRVAGAAVLTVTAEAPEPAGSFLVFLLLAIVRIQRRRR